jgi:hypothetical protein
MIFSERHLKLRILTLFLGILTAKNHSKKNWKLFIRCIFRLNSTRDTDWYMNFHIFFGKGCPLWSKKSKRFFQSKHENSFTNR